MTTGFNLEIWTLDELKKIVADFKASKASKAQGSLQWDLTAGTHNEEPVMTGSLPPKHHNSEEANKKLWPDIRIVHNEKFLLARRIQLEKSKNDLDSVFSELDDIKGKSLTNQPKGFDQSPQAFLPQQPKQSFPTNYDLLDFEINESGQIVHPKQSPSNPNQSVGQNQQIQQVQAASKPIPEKLPGSHEPNLPQKVPTKQTKAAGQASKKETTQPPKKETAQSLSSQQAASNLANTTKSSDDSTMDETFSSKPVVEVVNIYQESKNIFSSYRVFTLKTMPGGVTVKRSRPDFKWLCDKLAEEYPNLTVNFSIIRLLKSAKASFRKRSSKTSSTKSSTNCLSTIRDH